MRAPGRGGITYRQWHICHLVANVFGGYFGSKSKTHPCKSLGGYVKKYIIERELPKVGTLEREQLRQAACKSNQALRQLGPDIQWQESFVAADKTFCVYLAKDESIIHQHAKISGFPATKVTEIGKMIDPTTAS
jgi:Protein of unknown function (DUF4242)